MYEGGIKSGARKIMRTIFVLFAIVIFFYFGKVVLSYIDSDGTVTGSGSCKNSEGLAILDRAGVFGNLHPKCTDKAEESDGTEEADAEETKDKSWRSKY